MGPGLHDYGARISTVDSKGKRKWIYALQPKGKLYNYRTWLSFLYLLIFFGLPFIRVKGVPLFLFNFPQATFIFFGKVCPEPDHQQDHQVGNHDKIIEQGEPVYDTIVHLNDCVFQVVFLQ